MLVYNQPIFVFLFDQCFNFSNIETAAEYLPWNVEFVQLVIDLGEYQFFKVGISITAYNSQLQSRGWSGKWSM